MGSEAPPRLLDVRWRLDRPDGRPEFEAGHLPGAVYVDLDSELAELGAPSDGRHPLPSPARLQAAARAWGLCDGEPVVVYDDLANMSAARAWWLLRHAGIRDVRLLDGGLGAWRAAGLVVEQGQARPAPGNVSLAYGHLRVASIDEAAAAPQRGVLLDARARERYLGLTEPVDPRAGHIPGARSTPTAENVRSDGRFRSRAELRRRFGDAGVAEGVPVVTYCGSGVTAAHTVVALALAGYEAALYPGSWSQWSNLPGRDVETGP